MTAERKAPDKKAPGRKSLVGPDVVLLKDLAPRTDVGGGAGTRKVLFGQGPKKKPG